MCKISVSVIPKAGGKLKNDVICERGWKTNKEKKLYDSIFPQMNCFPFSTNLIKINHLPLSHQLTTESSPIPTLDYSSACSYVRHLFVIILTPEEGDLGMPWLLLQRFQPAAKLSRLWMRPGCHLCLCWEKSLRTNPTLNFQQRGENTSAVIQFNVVLFSFSQSHISLKSLCNNMTHTHTQRLIHWLYHVSCSHVSVTCSLCNSVAGLLMAWLKPNEIF